MLTSCSIYLDFFNKKYVILQIVLMNMQIRPKLKVIIRVCTFKIITDDPTN